MRDRKGVGPDGGGGEEGRNCNRDLLCEEKKIYFNTRKKELNL